MIKFFAFVVLLNAALVLSGPDQPDPVTELNRYLAGTVKSQDLVKQINALKGLVDSPNQLASKDESFPGSKLSSDAKNLAESISKLSSMDNEDSCGGPNVKILQDSIDFFLSYGEKLSKKLLAPGNPTSDLLKGYTRAVVDKCLESFDGDIRVEKYEQLESKMRYLDYIYGQVVTPREHHFDGLIRAQNLLLGGEDYEDLNTKKKIYAIISIIHNNQRKHKTIAGKSYWDEFITGPCEQFLADKRVQNILKGAANFAVPAKKINVFKSLKGHAHLLKWASRALTCEWARLPAVKAQLPT